MFRVLPASGSFSNIAARTLLIALAMVIGLFGRGPVQALHPDDGDNTSATATPITLGVAASGTHPDMFENDDDWYRFDAIGGVTYTVTADTGQGLLFPAWGVWAELFDTDGFSYLSGPFGPTAGGIRSPNTKVSFDWIAPTSGTYFILATGGGDTDGGNFPQLFPYTLLVTAGAVSPLNLQELYTYPASFDRRATVFRYFRVTDFASDPLDGTDVVSADLVKSGTTSPVVGVCNVVYRAETNTRDATSDFECGITTSGLTGDSVTLEWQNAKRGTLELEESTWPAITFGLNDRAINTTADFDLGAEVTAALAVSVKAGTSSGMTITYPSTGGIGLSTRRAQTIGVGVSAGPSVGIHLGPINPKISAEVGASAEVNWSSAVGIDLPLFDETSTEGEKQQKALATFVVYTMLDANASVVTPTGWWASLARLVTDLFVGRTYEPYVAFDEVGVGASVSVSGDLGTFLFDKTTEDALPIGLGVGLSGSVSASWRSIGPKTETGRKQLITLSGQTSGACNLCAIFSEEGRKTTNPLGGFNGGISQSFAIKLLFSGPIIRDKKSTSPFPMGNLEKLILEEETAVKLEGTKLTVDTMIVELDGASLSAAGSKAIDDFAALLKPANPSKDMYETLRDLVVGPTGKITGEVRFEQAKGPTLSGSFGLGAEISPGVKAKLDFTVRGAWRLLDREVVRRWVIADNEMYLISDLEFEETLNSTSSVTDIVKRAYDTALRAIGFGAETSSTYTPGAATSVLASYTDTTGRVSLDDAARTLTNADGSTLGQVAITTQVIGTGAPEPPSATSFEQSQVVLVGPPGIAFSTPARLEIELASGPPAASGNELLFRHDENAGIWRAIGTIAATAGSTLSTDIGSTGTYIIGLDTTAPKIGLRKPGAGFSATVTDVGSGIDPDSITLTVNGSPVTTLFDANNGLVRTLIAVSDDDDTLLAVSDGAGQETRKSFGGAAGGTAEDRKPPIIFNRRDGDTFLARILDIGTGIDVSRLTLVVDGTTAAHLYDDATGFVTTITDVSRDSETVLTVKDLGGLEARRVFGTASVTPGDDPDPGDDPGDSVVTPNRAPVTAEDVATTIRQRMVSIDVLANDTDADGDPLTIVSFTQPPNGSLVWTGAGRMEYTPNFGFSGNDSFDYITSDGELNSAAEHVIIVVIDSVPPTAADDEISIVEDTPRTFDPSTNDIDPDADVLEIISVTQPDHGTIVINSNGTLTYTPTDHFNGVDTFEYTVTDNNFGVDKAQVLLRVLAVQDAPIAILDRASVNEDASVVINVLSNDVELDGDALTTTEVSQPTNGTATINPDGRIQYVPDRNFNGLDTFTYTVSDGFDGLSTGKVEVEVVSINDQPEAVDDDVIATEDIPLVFTLVDNDLDIDGDVLGITLLTRPGHGAVTRISETEVRYRSFNNYNGVDAFNYTIEDGAGGSATGSVKVTIIPVNDTPEPSDDFIDAPPGILIEIRVLANDSDPDGDALSITSVSEPAQGVVKIVDGRFLTYTRNPGSTGADEFRYTVDDGTGERASAAVMVSAIGNRPPIAGDDSATTLSGDPIRIPLLGNDTDPDGDSLTVVKIDAPESGTAMLSGDDTILYLPPADFIGSVSFQYSVSDGNGAVATGSVTVLVEARPPGATPTILDSVTTEEDEQLTFMPVAPADSPPGDAITIEITSGPVHGSVVIEADGQITYNPDDDYFGEDTFSYVAQDSQGRRVQTNLVISVTPVNDAPEAANETIAPLAGESVVVAAVSLAQDADGDVLTVVDTSTPSNGQVTVNADGTVTYTPAEGFSGSDSFTYTLDDGRGGIDVVTVNVEVEAPVVEASGGSCGLSNSGGRAGIEWFLAVAGLIWLGAMQYERKRRTSRRG